MTQPPDDKLTAALRKVSTLEAQLGLPGSEPLSHEVLFVEIARNLNLADDAVQSITKFGYEESTIRIVLSIKGEIRNLDCPVRKLTQATFARGLIADVCNQVLPYSQKQWTVIANHILSAAKNVPGSTRDAETIEWVAEFVHRACTGHRGCSYSKKTDDGATIFDRIVMIRQRRAGVLEASYTGEVFLVLRPDDGVSFGQADFLGYVKTQIGQHVSRLELVQRLASIEFQKAPLWARKGSQTTGLKACWHSPPGWLKSNDVEISEPTVVRRADLGKQKDLA